MDEVSKHATASELSRSLCDLLLGCLPRDSAPSRNFNCGVHIRQRKAALCWVVHSEEHIRVVLRCEDTPDIRSQIKETLPKGVTLNWRPYPRANNWAISTPLFLLIHTEQQAKGMAPFLKLLSSYGSEYLGSARSAPNEYWHPPSEPGDDEQSAGDEGKRMSVLVNKYERSRRNRDRCVKAYGAWCRVCGFDFSLTYGEIGNGYIHVHHLTTLASLEGKAKKNDPIKDMRPVCPNCHEMLHRSDPPFSIEELKQTIEEVRAAGDKSSKSELLN